MATDSDSKKKQIVLGEKAHGGLLREQALAALEQLLADTLGPSGDAAEHIKRVGLLVDLAQDFNRADAVRRALEVGEELMGRDLPPYEQLLLRYCMGNAYSVRAQLRDPGASGLVGWDDGDVAQQIVHLRHAAQLSKRARLDKFRRCQILTNFGNLMSQCGRFVDALAYWDEALRVNAAFPMALGNRGWGLMRYALHLHDRGHQILHLREAYRCLVRSLAQPLVRQLHSGARAFFEDRLAALIRMVGKKALEAAPHGHRFRSRMIQSERRYRTWCLHNRLFLNDLNDLGFDPVAAADVLTLPDMLTGLDEGPPCALGLFNQLKQGYVSARFLFFEGSHDSRPHFSDRDVTLVNTFDYAAYGLATEKLRLAYRSGYSILDQAAFLLNDYFGLGIAEKRVSFRGIWYETPERKSLHAGFGSRLANAPLQALFWLAKDVYEQEQGFAEALEPTAKELADIRNHLEHKYLKLHWMTPPRRAADGRARFLGDPEPLAYSLDRDEFEHRALLVLKLARSALIYLGLAMKVEEEGRAKARSKRGRVGSIPLTRYRDEDKR